MPIVIEELQIEAMVPPPAPPGAGPDGAAPRPQSPAERLMDEAARADRARRLETD